MRPEILYLLDIIDAADTIGRFCAAISQDEFLRDELRQSAVLQKLIVIGEATSHLSKKFQEAHPDVEWPDIIGFRNIAVHEYFAILWEVVWTTARHDVPVLRAEIAVILNEFDTE